MYRLEGVLVSTNMSISQVMSSIDLNGKGIALVVDDSEHLLGTITDGDIRRAILGRIDLQKPIRDLLIQKSSTQYSKPITAPVGSSDEELLALMQKHSIQQIPLLKDGRVVDLALLTDFLPDVNLSVEAVVMAGGYGKRLHPFTEDLPKPMLPVGDQPMLELILEQLKKAGIQRVNITTHYLPEKIKEYFGDGKSWGVDLNYVTEDRPLGTAGALGILDPSEKTFLVINGDVLTTVDFKAMLKFHRKHQATLTVGVRQYDLEVPYGVIECDGPQVRALREKPKYNFLVNAGVYFLEPAIYQYLTPGDRIDMTDLIEVLIKESHTVVSFPIVEYWLDIGQPGDYEQAQEDVRDGKV